MRDRRRGRLLGASRSWVPPYAGSLAAAAGLPAPTWASYTGMTFTAAIVGYIGFGFLADAYGRKPITLLFFRRVAAADAGAVPVDFEHLYLVLVAAALLGCFASGQFTWTPIVAAGTVSPTRMRATGGGLHLQCLANSGSLRRAGRRPDDRLYFGGYGNAAITIAMI